jgi:hypothetical protein
VVVACFDRDDGIAAGPRMSVTRFPLAREVLYLLNHEPCCVVAVEGSRSAERLKRVKHRLVTTLLVVTAVVVATLTSVTTTDRPAQAAAGGSWDIDTWGGPPREGDNAVVKWNWELLQTITANASITGPTVTARALGVVHTAMYDAWAAYDPVALDSRLLLEPVGSTPRRAGEATTANKERAISYAAYKTLQWLFPDTRYHREASYATLMDQYRDDSSTAAAVGNAAAQAVIDYRKDDGANQLGDRNGGAPYSDYTGYGPANSWNQINVQRRWQPLCVLTSPAGVNAWKTDNSLPLIPSSCPEPPPPSGSLYVQQKELNPQWKNVLPFGPLKQSNHYPELFQLPGPPNNSTDVATALSDTSNLSDAAKVKAEYWADGPGSVFPPGHMFLFAQALSRMRQNTLDQDVKLFFILGNAMLDASVSAWAAKYQYDFWRPTSAIRELYKDKLVVSWLGPGKGYGKVLGKNWLPYQLLNVVTPAFPEYVSGHSTFSAAGRTVLTMFYGNNDAFGAKVTIPARTSAIEPGVTPAKDMVLSWKTLTEAADEAGMSRRYGGIHFYSGDQQGRALGRLIGYNDTNWAQDYYFKGSVPPPPPA